MIRFFLLKQQQASAGFALFGGGYNVGYLSSTDKYIYSTDVVTAGTSLNSAMSQQAACGNSVVAIFYGGLSGNCHVYTFSTNVVSGGASPSPTYRKMLAACGNSTTGIFAGGHDPLNSNVVLSSTQKYTYNTNTAVSSTSLGFARSELSACGDQTFGVFSGGSSSTSTDKYTYNTDSVSTGTSLLVFRYDNAACGDSIRGIFGGGSTGSGTISVSHKYTYSTDTVTAGTSFPISRYGHRACGNSTTGIFGGGSRNTDYSNTEKYTYSTDGVTAGTNLGTARRWLAAASSTPGHL